MRFQVISEAICWHCGIVSGVLPTRSVPPGSSASTRLMAVTRSPKFGAEPPGGNVIGPGGSGPGGGAGGIAAYADRAIAK